MTTSGTYGVTHCGPLTLEWGSRTYVMGIVNVTPDSFSGDGVAHDADAALEQALRFQAEGADIIDVGGESTRPGHTPVDADEEMRRVVPVIRLLASRLHVPVSVDTYKHEVAREAVAAGASMINDVWGLKREPALAEPGRPRGRANRSHAQPGRRRIRRPAPGRDCEPSRKHGHALRAGVPPGNIILDPGLGFGKTAEHNLELLRRLSELTALGQPLLVGTSRKSTIGLVLDLPVEERLEGTAATVALAIAGGADVVRVHDVKAMTRVARMSDAVVRGWSAPAGGA